ncbi:MAG: ATP-grasp domain-containing protein [Deltaproteobacteria bacterium]|nr:ATP-grasp domain-containing protein [Deltaproteobacteria bacterium]
MSAQPPLPIRRLAIVNRGEAAVRCIRAVKSLRESEASDLECLALYTEADRRAPFVRQADRAVRLAEEQGAVAAYLDRDALVELLVREDVDAVWPGWGFVAEDAEFVDGLREAGITFLGPTAEAMRAVGDKIRAKAVAEAAGVPVVPWSGGCAETVEAAGAAAETLGYPVALKASAGGGGRGIRMVESPGELEEAFRGASAEARSAFGDDRLFVERRITGGRHIEIQVVADEHGTVLALGGRDCSVQRRHQKVLEEAPPQGLAPGQLARLEKAARAIALAVGYRGVGTVEFLVTPEEFFFLELNPRLQVEHGVTEAVTGWDLVQWQIRIARGEALPAASPEPRGVAIEARVCAEDPDLDFMPSPGRVARFEPSLGPGVRIDTGITTGAEIPAEFDSLVAKVIASGDDREQALGRLCSALADFDLVVEAGASNKGFLLDVLASDDFRAGGVDTTWLDRFVVEREGAAPFAVEALVAATVLAYQRARGAARANFYADANDISPDRVPPSDGLVVDLVHRGRGYRLEVYAVGGWGYRVHLDGRALFVTFEEEGAHTGRLTVGERGFHVVHDAVGSDLRVEIGGHPHRFGRDTAGQVRAGTPAMVVALHVAPGDSVARGDTLGVLEAMKTEIRFDAPVAGVVKEVPVRVGAQVAAGDVLLVIEPEGEGAAEVSEGPALALPEVRDPLTPLFAPDQGAPDLTLADRAPAPERREAFRAVRTEVRRVLLGYDANLDRTARLAEFLEAPIPEGLSDAFRSRLAEIRHELTVFADVERLFIRSQRASVTGAGGPSNHARLRMFVRRMHAGGAGLHDEYLTLVERALAHYGVVELDGSDALERAVLRLLATQKARALRHRLVRAALSRVIRLARDGVHLGGDAELRSALDGIVGLRGLVADGLADAALEARYQVFERPEIEGRAERTSKQVEAWLDAAEADPTAPPGPVLAELAVAPRVVFDRAGGWLASPALGRRSVALGAHLLRLYHPQTPQLQTGATWDDVVLERIELSDGRVIVAAAAPASAAASALSRLARAAGVQGADAAELLVSDDLDGSECDFVLGNAAGAGIDADRLTVGWVREGGPDRFETLLRGADDAFVPAPELHGVHPEVADRIELSRLSAFDLERLDADDGIYAFRARAKESPGDERMIVLADVHGAGNGPEAAPHIPVFERMFHAAARTLRQLVARHDPKRRLQWNRIALFVAPALVVEQQLASDLSSRLAPATRHLGLEKVLVRLRLLDAADPARPVQTLEIEINELPGSRMDLHWREPHSRPLEPRSPYERRVGEARRRGLVEPYEIVRMLCGGGRAPGAAGDPSLPPARFEEFDLAEGPAEPHPRAVSVDGRAHGRNDSGVVFGVITTPTEKVPEGMRRVLVLSDPTRHMGALAAGECDRLVAALDLAEAHGLPVEWVPVSSGARIAMDSGTENLDATARVVRRIIEFTDAGHTIHVIVDGVNVGAQSYFDALSTMGARTRGVLIMTQRGSMVLTGRAALAASGAVSAEDEVAIGGYERVMGPNGEAQYLAQDLADAFRILYQHYHFSYVVPGEGAPRRHASSDPVERDVTTAACADPSAGFATVGEIFDDATNPGRKAPFAMRDVMSALVDTDGGHLERWPGWVGAETAITWDAHLGGHAVTLIGVESQPTVREGYRPLDGPETWSGGTLFPLSSKKVARSLAADSGVRPAVVLANLSGFDGSPESMRKLQLEYGAQIARAVVQFRGPILFTVVSRYHGGAYVVFSGALNDGLRPAALAGSYASVIGGGAAAAVVFPRDVRARAAADPRVEALEAAMRAAPSPEARARYDETFSDVLLEKQSAVAAEFDGIHTVERARTVGSLESIIDPRELRPILARQLDAARKPR